MHTLIKKSFLYAFLVIACGQISADPAHEVHFVARSQNDYSFRNEQNEAIDLIATGIDAPNSVSAKRRSYPASDVNIPDVAKSHWANQGADISGGQNSVESISNADDTEINSCVGIDSCAGEVIATDVGSARNDSTFALTSIAELVLEDYEAAEITSPINNDNFKDSDITFTWTDTGSPDHILKVGSNIGSGNYFNGHVGAQNVTSVSGLPVDEEVFVELWTKIDNDPNNNLFWIRKYKYNVDLDEDGVWNSLDDRPDVADPLLEVQSGPYNLKILSSGRVVALEVPESIYQEIAEGQSSSDLENLSRAVLDPFEDNFDFIMFTADQDTANTGIYGIYTAVKNDTEGLGSSNFDSSSMYGSAGTLQGVIEFPRKNALRGGPSLHEIVHRWANDLDAVRPEGAAYGGSHWGFSGVGGQLGGWDPDTLVELEDGLYQAKAGVSSRTNFGLQANGGNTLPYAPIELYLMGMLDIGEVPDIKVAVNPTWVNGSQGIFRADELVTVTAQDIINIDGIRIPDHLNSQKDFRILYVVVTTGSITWQRWGSYDQDVYNFSLPGPDNDDWLYNFWEATREVGTVRMDGLLESLAFPVRITNVAGVSVREGPGDIYAVFNHIDYGQQYYAVGATVNEGGTPWQRIYLPCGNTGKCGGWIEGGANAGFVREPKAKIVRVFNTAPLGLNIRKVPTGNVIDSAYDDQRFVSFATSPAGNGCASLWHRIFTPQSSTANSGWVCGDYLQVKGVVQSCDTPLTGYVTDAGANNAPLVGVSIEVDGNEAATSGAGGYYQVESLGCGSHTVAVERSGYADYSRSYLHGSQSPWLNIQLTRESAALGIAETSGFISDPVNTATGNYIYEHRDLEIAAPGFPFRMERFYNSRAASEAGAAGTPLGYGWRHKYQVELSFDGDGNALIRWGDGRTDTHAPDGLGGYVAQYGVFDTLTAYADGTYTLRQRDHTRYHFNAGLRPIAIADRNDNTLGLNYTGSQLTSITDTAGRTIQLDYDASDRISKVTDPLGRSVDYAYDANGDLVSATDPNGNVTTYTYDADHQMLTVVNPRGHTVATNTYDDDRRVVTYQTDAKGYPTEFAYEEVDRITTITQALGIVTVHEHDELLRLVKATDARGGVMAYEYDPAGNRVQVTDRNGNTTQYTYDARGNVIGKTDALGNQTIITYDTDDNPLTRTDALGRVTTFAYDANFNLVQTTDALGQVTATTYNSRGLPLTITDPLTRVITYDYDAEGNRIAVTDALGQTSLASFDGVGRRLTSTDALGRVTTYAYDANDNLLSITDALGQATSHTYDGNNNRTSTTDSNGHTTTWAYDQKDLVTTETDPQGGVESYTYGWQDRRHSMTNRRGKTTTYGYDEVGNRVQVHDPLGNTTESTYDLSGNRTSITDARGNTTTFTHDALNRLLQTTDALGHSWQTTYDAVGNRVSTTDALGHTITSTFDALDRQLTITNPLGHTASTTYDAGGRVITTTDAKGRTTAYSYDDLDRLVEVTDAAGGVVEYAYDAVGNRTAMTDPNGNTTTYAYDDLDRLTTTTEPLGHITSLAYDPAGNLVQKTDPKGQVTQFVYDALHRRTSIQYQGQAPVTLSYDAVSNLVQVADGLGTTIHTYDAADRRTGTTDPFGQTVGYHYDDVGNRVALIYPDGNAVNYTFDDANRLQAVSVPPVGNLANYSYDAAGRLTGTTYANGTSTSYSYDNAYRLTGLTNARPDTSTISAYAYTLDPVGNPVTEDRQEPLAPYSPNGQMDNSHDTENRETDTGGVVATFDNNGNRTSFGADSYDFDTANQLVEAGVDGVATTYSYDGLGNRYQRQRGGVVTRYVLDTLSPLTQVLAETDGTGTISHYNIYGHGLVARIDSGGNIRFPHYDPRGSTVALTDHAGLVTDLYAYEPFGHLTKAAGNSPNPYRFLGRHGVLDEGAGLNYVRARYYDTDQQRFISKDAFTGDARQSQTLNRFVYALNSPVRLVDVSGFSAQDTQVANSTLAGPSNISDEVYALLQNIGVLANDPLAKAIVNYLAKKGVNKVSKWVISELTEQALLSGASYNDFLLGMWESIDEGYAIPLAGIAVSSGFEIYENYGTGMNWEEQASRALFKAGMSATGSAISLLTAGIGAPVAASAFGATWSISTGANSDHLYDTMIQAPGEQIGGWLYDAGLYNPDKAFLGMF